MKVFQRQTEGSWKIRRDIMNSNNAVFVNPIEAKGDKEQPL